MGEEVPPPSYKPWAKREGTSSGFRYTKEHFCAARNHLNNFTSHQTIRASGLFSIYLPISDLQAMPPREEGGISRISVLGEGKGRETFFSGFWKYRNGPDHICTGLWSHRQIFICTHIKHIYLINRIKKNNSSNNARTWTFGGPGSGWVARP